MAVPELYASRNSKAISRKAKAHFTSWTWRSCHGIDFAVHHNSSAHFAVLKFCPPSGEALFFVKVSRVSAARHMTGTKPRYALQRPGFRGVVSGSAMPGRDFEKRDLIQFNISPWLFGAGIVLIVIALAISWSAR